MNPTLRLMSQLLVLACIPSLLYFSLWAVTVAPQEITGSGFGRLFPFQTQNPVLWKMLTVWWFAGGICGWISLFLLYRRGYMHFSQVPRFIVTGILIGIIAALSLPPFPNKYSFAPVILACLLLATSCKNPPPPSQATSTKNDGAA